MKVNVRPFYPVLIFIILGFGCVNLQNSKTKYYSDFLLWEGAEFFSNDFLLRLLKANIEKENIPGYIEVNYRDDGKIDNVKSFRRYSSDLILTDGTTKYSLDESSDNKKYKLSNLTKFTYDEKGRLVTVESYDKKTVLTYIDTVTAKFVGYENNQIDTNGIIKFMPDGRPFLVLFLDEDYLRSISIHYDLNKKIYEISIKFSQYEKYELEYKNDEIVGINYQNDHGEEYERLINNNFNLHKIK
jgi:hypothetical protein